MGEAVLQTGRRRLLASDGRPVATAREAARVDAHIVGVVSDGEGNRAQIVERLGRPEWRQDPSAPIRYDSERRDVYFTLTVDRGDDRFTDHRHRLILRFASAQGGTRPLQMRSIFAVR